MTERLYNQDVYTKTFTGTVRSCTEVPGQEGYEVILDRTAFFPEEAASMVILERLAASV